MNAEEEWKRIEAERRGTPTSQYCPDCRRFRPRGTWCRCLVGQRRMEAADAAMRDFEKMLRAHTRAPWVPFSERRAALVPEEADRRHAAANAAQRALCADYIAAMTADETPVSPLVARTQCEEKIADVLFRLFPEPKERALLFHCLVKEGFTRDRAESELRKAKWWLT